MADDIIITWPKMKRELGSGAPIKRVFGGKCLHGNFLVNEEAAEVECGVCHEKLNPIWVLQRIAIDDRILVDRWAFMKAELQLMHGRVRTKCDHCGHMTAIRSNVRSMDRDKLAAKFKKELDNG